MEGAWKKPAVTALILALLVCAASCSGGGGDAAAVPAGAAAAGVPAADTPEPSAAPESEPGPEAAPGHPEAPDADAPRRPDGEDAGPGSGEQDEYIRDGESAGAAADGAEAGIYPDAPSAEGGGGAGAAAAEFDPASGPGGADADPAGPVAEVGGMPSGGDIDGPAPDGAADSMESGAGAPDGEVSDAPRKMLVPGGLVQEERRYEVVDDDTLKYKDFTAGIAVSYPEDLRCLEDHFPGTAVIADGAGGFVIAQDVTDEYLSRSGSDADFITDFVNENITYWFEEIYGGGWESAAFNLLDDGLERTVAKAEINLYNDDYDIYISTRVFTATYANGDTVYLSKTVFAGYGNDAHFDGLNIGTSVSGCRW